MKSLLVLVLLTITASSFGAFTPFPPSNPDPDSITAKGNLLTSDGASQTEFSACADTEIIEFDSAETEGFKCVAKPVPIPDTNAGTICATTELLNGDGTCETIPVPIPDTNAGTICASGELLNGDGTCEAIAAATPLMLKGSLLTSDGTSNGELVACADGEILEYDMAELTGLKCVAQTVNTDAESKCTGTNYLNGDGNCVAPAAGGGDVGDSICSFNKLGTISVGNCSGFSHGYSGGVHTTTFTTPSSSWTKIICVCSAELESGSRFVCTEGDGSGLAAGVMTYKYITHKADNAFDSDKAANIICHGSP